MCNDVYGVAIERGRIFVTPDGARVVSLSREGITTPPLPILSGQTVTEGELVYFFMFDDGRGLIIGRAW